MKHSKKKSSIKNYNIINFTRQNIKKKTRKNLGKNTRKLKPYKARKNKYRTFKSKSIKNFNKKNLKILNLPRSNKKKDNFVNIPSHAKGTPELKEITSLLGEHFFLDENGNEINTRDEMYTYLLKMYHLDLNRNEIIIWKNEKNLNPYYINNDTQVKYTYRDYLPENNFILYLIENMPENIVGGNMAIRKGQTQQDIDNKVANVNWIRADKAGLSTEARILLYGASLSKSNIKRNFWIDKRVLGPHWKGTFDQVKAGDEIIMPRRPRPPS